MYSVSENADDSDDHLFFFLCTSSNLVVSYFVLGDGVCGLEVCDQVVVKIH